MLLSMDDLEEDAPRLLLFLVETEAAIVSICCLNDVKSNCVLYFEYILYCQH